MQQSKQRMKITTKTMYKSNITIMRTNKHTKNETIKTQNESN